MDLDTAIKIVAGILFKFFSGLEIEKDRFDTAGRNDKRSEAVVIESGTHSDLTIHAPYDEDYYRFRVSDDYGEVRVKLNFDTSARDSALTAMLEFQECDSSGGCVSHYRYGEKTDAGWSYYEDQVPAGREYLVHVYAFDLRTFTYELVVAVGAGELPADPHEPNGSANNAATWSPWGCDFTGRLNLQSDSDNDFYELVAQNMGVEVQATFDSDRGDIHVWLDGVEATEQTLIDDGTTKQVTIRGCGRSSSIVEISGRRGFYDLCVNRVSPRGLCPNWVDWVPYVASGTFEYLRFDPLTALPGTMPTELVRPIHDHVFAKPSSPLDADSVTWTFGGWVEHGPEVMQGFYGHFDANPYGPSSTSTTVRFLNAPWHPEWYQVGDAGVVDLRGPHDQLEEFSVTSGPMGWHPARPDDRGALSFVALVDSDEDFLPNALELGGNTSAFTDDTDDDGLLDGREDSDRDGVVDPGETDPLKWDTDGDSLSDGTESGLTAPQGSDTDKSTFRADADPATTTNPAVADTDGDGVDDGAEDANLNGRLDPGETSAIEDDGSFAPLGSSVKVTLDHGVTVTFREVLVAGFARSRISNDVPAEPNGAFEVLGGYVDITTTAEHSGPIQVCFVYPPETTPTDLEVRHLVDGEWVAPTTVLDPEVGEVCAEVSSVSWFALAERPSVSPGCAAHSFALDRQLAWWISPILVLTFLALHRRRRI